jgi:polyribonucleotide nucleotidyltransferase
MIIREKVRVGDQIVTLETGRIAKQAGGSCLVRAGDTMVLVTVCGNQDAKPGQSFFPLSVDYVEKTYSAGKIPGGFFKREGKLRDYEVLTSRLIDRPCRPLFPEGYLAEVQIVATVMSFDKENPPDTLAMIGASAALHISQIPWKGPIAGVRVGRIDGEFIANPTFAQIAESDCELIVAASRDAIVMVEGEADEMSEEDLIDALLFAHHAIQDSLDLMDRMRSAVGKPKWSFHAETTPSFLKDRVEHVAGRKVREACNIAEKHARYDRFKQIKRELVEAIAHEFPGQEQQIKAAYDELHYNAARAQVLEEGRRLDGRDTRTVRPISIELGLLPRTHGSALFTRGETQAIVTTTLGTSRDEQRIDMLTGDIHKNFLLHYNFPPYSVGEVKMMRGPGRREVGHGNLAERALAKMMPKKEEFPYTIRLVSEITESNGSSSMASVCGGSLALMEAGVPMKSPVAGVAMGLIKEGDDYAILTDILGDEDHLGDMDFKVCGTERGVTAIQMDIKIDGLSREILEQALEQAREGRLHILDKMRQALAVPRTELSRYAPRITQIRVKPDQVRTIIGPGGKMIRAIVDQTGASIDVEDDGTVSVASSDSAAAQKAIEIIKSLTTEPEIGEIYEGTVKRIEPYGAFIEILPGKDGLCHISDIDWTHVNSVEDYVRLGDKVSVKITNIDRDGRIRLSRKDALAAPEGGAVREERPARVERAARPPREERPARIEREERPARIEREERPARIEREERPARIEREERPARIAREERPAPARIEREERPARIEREERPARIEREERPARIEREERPARIEREERPARIEREERPARIGRDERPARIEREERPARIGREDRPARIEREDRPARIEREDRPARIEREDRPARIEREERPARIGRDERPARIEREDRPARIEREDRPARIEREDRPARIEREDRPARIGREERPARIEREERPARIERDERAARPRVRDEEPAARVRDFDRPVRVRDEEPAARVRDFDRPVRVRDEDVAEARVARPRELERPARGRELERPVRPRDEEERPARGRDFERPARVREDEERGPRPQRNFDGPARGRDAERSPRGRDDERMERPKRDSEIIDRKPARGRFDEPRGPRIDDERFDEPRGPRLDEDRFDDREAKTSVLREREERTERERPSRSRSRARTRDRVREIERERERR